MDALLKLSEALRKPLEWIALASGWLMVIMAFVTTFDVVARKFGVPLPYTKLQELEWQFHAAIFSLWMGYCYTINAHPRVDSFTERMTYRGKAWVELIGCVAFALPYCALVAYHSIDFVASSYAIGEQSDSTVGLTHRWIIVFLFGNKSREEVNLQIGTVIMDV
jgi:TRAP-type mannitol/chloroaromatic compound transport system permease small subunit